ncbi:Rab5-interacting protein-domain-containing protein [Dichotomocladium elegans]|nr:Rab5-interacting protein-domain-containing protein [Dichotomocladium elegans]
MNANANNQQPNENAYKFHQPYIMHNAKQLQFIRSCFAAIAGSAAGILGLTNWTGFLFYALCWTVLAALLVVIKCKSQPGLYFVNGWRELVVDGAMNGLLSYILFHTFLYGLVHLYQ